MEVYKLANSVSLTSKKLKKYIGKNIFVEKADGTRVEGKLVAVKNGNVYMKPITTNSPNKPVKTSFFFIGLWVIGILALVAVGLLLWCACCGSRVHRHRRCRCGCRRRPYRARRPHRRHRVRRAYG